MAKKDYPAEVAALVEKLGPAHPAVAEMSFEHAEALFHTEGAESEAILQYEECLSVERAARGDITLIVARALRRIGELHLRTGDLKRALSALYASLERNCHLVDKDASDLVQVLLDLSYAYSGLFRTVASSYARKVADDLKREAQSGANTTYVLDACIELADVLAVDRYYVESDGLYKIAIQLAETRLEKRDQGIYFYKYAAHLEARGEYEDCRLLYLDAAEAFVGTHIQDDAFVEEDPVLWSQLNMTRRLQVAKCYNGLGRVFRELNSFSNAVIYHERAIAIILSCIDISSGEAPLVDDEGTQAVDLLVHCKGCLGVTVTRRSQFDAERAQAMVNDAILQLSHKDYPAGHPLMRSLLPKEHLIGHVSTDDDETADSLSLNGHNAYMPFSQTVGSEASIGSGRSTPLQIEADFVALAAEIKLNVDQSKAVKKTIKTMLVDAGKSMLLGQLTASHRILIDCLNFTKERLVLDDAMTGEPLPLHGRILHRVSIAAADSYRRLGNVVAAKEEYSYVMAKRGINCIDVSNALVSLKHKQIDHDILIDIECLMGFMSCLREQGDQDRLESVWEECIRLLEWLETEHSFSCYLFDTAPDTEFKTLSRFGILQARVLLGSSANAWQRMQYARARQYSDKAIALCKGKDMISKSNIDAPKPFQNNAFQMEYKVDFGDNRIAYQGDFNVIECAVYIDRCRIELEAGNISEALNWQSKVSSLINSLCLSSQSHTVVENDLLKASISLQAFDVTAALKHLHELSPIITSHPSDDSPLLSAAIFFLLGEASRIAGEQVNAEGYYSSALELTNKFIGSKNWLHLRIVISRADNKISNGKITQEMCQSVIESLLSIKRGPVDSTEAIFLRARVDTLLMELRLRSPALFDSNQKDGLKHLLVDVNATVAHCETVEGLLDSCAVREHNMFLSQRARLVFVRIELLLLVGRNKEAIQACEILLGRLGKSLGAEGKKTNFLGMCAESLKIWSLFLTGQEFPSAGDKLLSHLDDLTTMVGLRSPVVISCMLRLGIIFAEYGFFRDEYYQRSMNILLETASMSSINFGSQSIEYAKCAKALGTLLIYMKKYSDALPYVNTANTILVSAAGPSHIYMCDMQVTFVLYYWFSGDLQLARAHLNQYSANIEANIRKPNYLSLISSALKARVDLQECINQKVTELSSALRSSLCQSVGQLVDEFGLSRHHKLVMFLAGAGKSKEGSAANWYLLLPKESDNIDTEFLFADGRVETDSKAAPAVQDQFAVEKLEAALAAEKENNRLLNERLILLQSKTSSVSGNADDAMRAELQLAQESAKKALADLAINSDKLAVFERREKELQQLLADERASSSMIYELLQASEKQCEQRDVSIKNMVAKSLLEGLELKLTAELSRSKDLQGVIQSSEERIKLLEMQVKELSARPALEVSEVKSQDESNRPSELERVHQMEIDGLKQVLARQGDRIASLERRERELIQDLTAEKAAAAKLTESMKQAHDAEASKATVPKEIFDAIELRLTEETAKNVALQKERDTELEKFRAEVENGLSRIKILEERERGLSNDLRVERSASVMAAENLIDAEKRFSDERNAFLDTMVSKAVLVATEAKHADDLNKHLQMIQSLEQKIAESLSAQTSVKSDLDSERQKSLNLVSENSKLQALIDGMVPKAVLETSNEKLRESEQRAASLEKSLHDTEEELKAQIVVLNQDVDQLRVNLESATAEKESYKAEAATIKGKFDAELALVTENMVSRYLLEAMELRMAEELGQLESLRSQLAQAEEALTASQEELKRQAFEVESNRAHVDELVVENEHLYSEYQRLLKLTQKPPVNPLEKTVAALYAKISELESSLDASERDRSKLSNELHKLTGGNAAASAGTRKQSEIPIAHKDPSQLRSELQAAQHKIESLEKKIEGLQNARRQLDPWGFSKEAELGYSRFQELRRALSVGYDMQGESEQGSNNKPHKTDSSNNEVFAGAIPARFFTGMRSMTAEGPREKASKAVSPSPYATTATVHQYDFPRLCVHCGRDPDDIRSVAPAKESPQAALNEESESRANSPNKDSNAGHLKMPSIQKKMSSFQHSENNRSSTPGSLQKRAQTAQSLFLRPQPQSVLHHALGVEPFGMLHSDASKQKKALPDGQEHQALFVKRPFSQLPSTAVPGSPLKEVGFASTR